MKTIELKIYSFEELSDDAKQVALSNYIPNTDYIWDEAYSSVKAFNKLFELKEGLNSWLEYRINRNDDILELKGLRLRKWIINNYEWALYRSRYIKSMPNGKVWKHKNLRDKSYGQVYYSSVFKDDTCCVLTGVCYDDDLLKPIYEFIEYKDATNYQHTTLEDLFDDCFYEMSKCIERACDYIHSDECKAEQLIENGIEFLENGNKF